MPIASSTPSTSGRTLAGLLLATVLFGGLTLGYPVGGWDIPTYSYVASVIREGGVPYRDAWDLKSPGIFFAHAIGQAILGTSPVGIRVFDLLWQLVTAVLVAQLAGLVCREGRAGLLAGWLYLLTYFARNGWDWAQPDSLVSLPLAAGVLAALRGKESGRFWPWLAAGASIGVAALLKPPFGLLGIAFLVLAATGGRGRIRGIAASWLALAVGLAAPLGACLGYFWAHGAIGELWATQFVLVPEYVANIHAYRSLSCLLRSALQPVNAPVHAMGMLLLIFLMGAGWRKRENLPAVGLLLAWVGVVLAALVLHGKYDSMHYAGFLAPLAVLSGPAMQQLWSRWRERRAWWAIAVLAVLAITLVVPANKFRQHARLLVQRISEGDHPAGPIQTLGATLREKTARADTIFVWGNVPAVYYYAQRRSSSRFIHVYFLTRSWGQLDLRPGFLQEWREHPPRFFVLIKSPNLTAPGRETAFFQCKPEEIDPMESYLRFAELRSMVERNYRVTAETAAYVLYRRQGEESGDPARLIP